MKKRPGLAHFKKNNNLPIHAVAQKCTETTLLSDG